MAGTGWVALPEVRKGSGSPPRDMDWAKRPSWRTGSGRDALLKGRQGLEAESGWESLSKEWRGWEALPVVQEGWEALPEGQKWSGSHYRAGRGQ